MKRFKEPALNVMQHALKGSKFLFAGEALNLFAPKGYLDHYEYKPKYSRDVGVDKDIFLQYRYLLSCLYGFEGEIYLHPCEPCDIVPIDKDIQIIFLKCLACNGYINDQDFETVAGRLLLYFDILSSREVTTKPKEKLSDLINEIQAEQQKIN